MRTPAGQLEAANRSNRPQRLSLEMLVCQIMWVDMVSLGNAARSTSSTR